MAPEMHRREAYNGRAADAWSLGVMGAALLLQAFPYATPDAASCP